MKLELSPLQVLLMTLAGIVNRHQQRISRGVDAEGADDLLRALHGRPEDPTRVVRRSHSSPRRVVHVRRCRPCYRLVLKGKRFVICDRDSKFSRRFKLNPQAAGVAVLRTPYQAPNCNAHAERFVLSVKRECLDKLILFGESRLRRSISEFAAHYHGERTHQGIGNELIEAPANRGRGEVVCRERLGGLLRFYHRAA